MPLTFLTARYSGISETVLLEPPDQAICFAHYPTQNRYALLLEVL